MIDMNFIGMKEMIAELRMLNDAKTENRLMKKALHDALEQEVLPSVIAHAPEGETGKLKSGLHIDNAKRRGEIGYSIKSSAEAYYAFMVETGHQVHSLSGATKVSPQPFMRPAFDSHKEAMFDKAIQLLQIQLDEIAKAAGTL